MFTGAPESRAPDAQTRGALYSVAHVRLKIRYMFRLQLVHLVLAVCSCVRWWTLATAVRRGQQKRVEKQIEFGRQLDIQIEVSWRIDIQKLIVDFEVHFVHGSGAYDSALVMTDVLKLLSKPEEKD